ncbi:MAG: DUF2169 domain-containing protein, partial [Actinobacteria bacterium]|nr:DUF2169 domain-containing protein [Actinomycetota bacterium]
MQLLNTTPYSVGYLLGRVRYPAPSLSIVVKGTFDLHPGAAAAVAAEQRPLVADIPMEDEVPVSLRYPADLVHYTPRADVLCVGDCHAGREPVAHTTVRLSVGAWSKALRVTGDRTWGVTGASVPEPFRSIPIGYERAFGGPGFAANPVGRGLSESASATGKRAVWLPNVELIDPPVAGPGSRVAPAGFGPLRPSWSPRAEKVGSHGADWLEQRWPWQPEDYDFGHLNSAPEDMQLPFLRGDEEVTLSRLHPEHEELRTALPGLRVRCFLGGDGAPGQTPLLRELHLMLDTVWIDAAAVVLVLVWRGVADVADADADEVKYLYVSEEPVAAPPLPLGAAQERFDALLAEQNADEPPPDLPPDTPPDDADFDEAMAAAEEQAHAQMRRAGLDPDNLPSPSAEEKAAEAARLVALGFDPFEDDAAPAWTRESVRDHAAGSGSLSGQDLRGLDLSELDLSGIDFSGADLEGANLSGARLVSATLDGAILASANLEQAQLAEATLVNCDLTGARLTGVSAARARFDGAVLEGAALTGGRFERVSAQQLSATGADLSRAVLAGANLSQANLSGGVLEDADLSEADLTAATLEGVGAARLDARGANLSELRAAEGSDFSSARLDR